MKRRSLVIIPCYNENTNIAALLKGIFSSAGDIDALVIDDNSPDGTAETVRKICASEPRARLIVRPGKMGLGTAYLAGFAWALNNGYDRIMTMDADLSHPPREVPVLMGKLDTVDMIVGSRYVAGGGIDGWPLGRRLLSRAGNRYARFMTGIPVRDCTSGFTAMRRELVSEIIRKDIRTEGYAFLLESKYLAWSKGYQIEEHPITFIDRKAGDSKISRKIIVEAIIVALRLRLNAYKARLRGNALFKQIDRYAGIPAVAALGLIGRMFPGRKRGTDNVLVIKLSALGDTVLLMPALRALRRHLPPGAKITALCTNINSEIMKACPYVDETIVVDVNRIALNPLRLLNVFGGRGFDTALDFDQWLRLSPILSFLSGAPQRIGFRTPGQFRQYLYTDAVDHVKERHEVECFLDIVRKLGARGDDQGLEYWIPEDAMTAAKEVLATMGLAGGERFIVLHPETPAHGIQRQWPAERYAALGKRLADATQDAILISGTSREIAENRKTAAAIGGKVHVVPPVTIQVFAGILSRARLVVCGNTGIMHLACALDVPVVALHGPTDPVKWGPFSKNHKVVASRLSCSPCLYLGFEYGCGRNACMQSISVEEVYRAAAGILAISS